MFSPESEVLSNIAAILVLAVLVEALTELFAKSYIFQGIRSRLSVNSGLEILVSCGYCLSFWFSLLITSLSFLYGTLPYLAESAAVNFLVAWILLQRLSNFVHGAYDRYFDTRKDIRYNRLSDN